MRMSTSSFEASISKFLNQRVRLEPTSQGMLTDTRSGGQFSPYASMGLSLANTLISDSGFQNHVRMNFCSFDNPDCSNLSHVTSKGENIASEVGMTA